MPVFPAGQMPITWARIIVYTSLAGATLSTLISGKLIFSHWLSFNVPEEQIHIVRLLLMVPIYSVTSYLSLIFLDKHTYFDCCREVCGACLGAFLMMCAWEALPVPCVRGTQKHLAPIDLPRVLAPLLPLVEGDNFGPRP